MSTPPRKYAPSSNTTRGAARSPSTEAELSRTICSSAAKSPCTLPSMITIRPLILALTLPSDPTVTECDLRSTEPSNSPSIKRSSSPVTSPLILILRPTVANSGVRDRGVAVPTFWANRPAGLVGRSGVSFSLRMMGPQLSHFTPASPCQKHMTTTALRPGQRCLRKLRLRGQWGQGGNTRGHPLKRAEHQLAPPRVRNLLASGTTSASIGNERDVSTRCPVLASEQPFSSRNGRGGRSGV